MSKVAIKIVVGEGVEDIQRLHEELMRLDAEYAQRIHEDLIRLDAKVEAKRRLASEEREL